jgi:hypothetical protein
MRTLFGRKPLEVLLNVAIVVLTIVVIYSFVSPRLRSKPDGAPPVGSRLEISGVTPKDHRSTLVMVLQIGCKYCKESAEFYRKLFEARGAGSDPHFIAVVPAAELTDSTKYLSDSGIPADHVLNISMTQLNVAFTPTLLLLDESGTIRERWIGKVPAGKEHEVMDRILGSRF